MEKTPVKATEYVPNFGVAVPREKLLEEKINGVTCATYFAAAEVRRLPATTIVRAKNVELFFDVPKSATYRKAPSAELLDTSAPIIRNCAPEIVAILKHDNAPAKMIKEANTYAPAFAAAFVDLMADEQAAKALVKLGILTEQK